MAEKGFGVKEINLIGASGTPTIESPNNLNLNAVNVAISTNATIGGNLTVTGNVGIAGTLTYEDVTNIDAIGIITARAGVVVGDTSNTSFRVHRTQGSSATNCGIAFNSGGSLDLFTDSSGAGTSRISISAAGNIQFSTMGSTYFLLEDYVTHAGDTDTQFGFDTANSYIVKTGGTTRLAVNLSGIQVTGTVAATQLNGGGVGITNLDAANLASGTIPDARFPSTLPAVSGANLTNLPSPTPTTSDIQIVYEITSSSSSSYYRFSGNGVDSSANNPDLYLERGKKYRFINNSGGVHPFRIQSDNGSTLYSTGVTNNNSSTGNIDFAIRWDAPGHLYYKCGQHPSMLGNIYISSGQYNTQKNNPVFWAYRTSNYNLTTSATEMVYDTEKIDVGGNYNTSNGRFTAPFDGLYEFGYASIGHNTNTVYRYALRVNGAAPYSGMTLELRIDTNSSGSEYGTNGEYCCYVNMIAGQTASVYATSDTSTNCYGNSTYGYTYFRGRLIG